MRIRKAHGGKGREFSGPVAVQRPSGERAPGTGRAGEVERVTAHFSKCGVEDEQRERERLPHHEVSYGYLERLGCVLRALGSHRRF